MPDFFPWSVVITHFLNIFFMVLLFRSGLEVLTALIKHLGQGQGGSREDQHDYANVAGI